jgi:hypothetical protein
MKTQLIAAAVLALTASAPASAQQPPELIGVHHCKNGMTFTVSHCQRQAGAEYCDFKAELSGRAPFQGADLRERVAEVVKACSKEGSAATATTGHAANESFNPPYLGGMPSIDLVKHEIQGKDATDTLARQIAVFNLLPEVIQRFQLADRTRYDPTPDEQKITGQYRLGAYELEEGYKKTHTAAEAQEFARLHGRYELDQVLNREMYTKLFSAAFLEEYRKVDKSINQWYQAHLDQERRAGEEQTTQSSAAQNGSPFIRNDPGTLAARRCVELGGSEMECVGKGLFSGFMDMAGVNADAMKQPGPSGVVMNGSYSNSSGLSVWFGPKSFSLNGCGKLVPNGHAYTIRKQPNQLQIDVQSTPSAFVLSVGNDGKLSGPAAVDINGQIITGYRNVWMQEYRNGVAVAGGGYWTSEPVYAPKTEHCSIGTLSAAPLTAATSQVEKAATSALTSVMGSAMETGPTGLRMTGQYASPGGLALEFSEASVVLDCGEAHVKQSYTIENAPTQFLITVKNGSSPFTMTLQPNGALAGSGSTEVTGRVVTGSTSNALTYAPRNARCMIGTLTPKTGH